MDDADFHGEWIRVRRLDRRRQQTERRREKRAKRFQGYSAASRSWCLDGHGFGQSLLVIAVEARAPTAPTMCAIGPSAAAAMPEQTKIRFMFSLANGERSACIVGAPSGPILRCATRKPCAQQTPAEPAARPLQVQWERGPPVRKADFGRLPCDALRASHREAIKPSSTGLSRRSSPAEAPEIARLDSMKARQPGRFSDQSSKPPVRGVLDSGNPSSQRKRTPKTI